MKEQIEQRLGQEISEPLYKKALIYAKNKQNYIYANERREIVLQEWYLQKLIEEYVRILAFSKFTMDLCRMFNDMEKEHSAICQSALND